MNPSLNAQFAQNVHFFRLQQGLSQESLAEACDLHRTYIGSIERGQANVTLATVQLVASGLGVDPLRLLFEVQSNG